MSSLDDETLQALASMQLPHMPQELKGDGMNDLPSIRIMVVADIDLPSAAALAEYCLQQRNTLFDASMIDLCIACGPFCRDEDARPYLTGKQRNVKGNSRSSRRSYPTSHPRNSLSHLHNSHDSLQPNSPSAYHHSQSSSYPSQIHQHSTLSSSTPVAPIETTIPPPNPFCRSREETAGLEGLMTASLSQLESIVCRVVYCPGSSDPITTMMTTSQLATQPNNQNSKNESESRPPAPSDNRRLTPNSRNIHRQWLPLAPALGCAGLVHLDSIDTVMGLKQTQSMRAWGRRRSSGNDGTTSSDDDDERGNNHDDEMEHLSKTMIQSQTRSKGYIPTLKRLLHLAPSSKTAVPFAPSQSQSILVTHYVDYSLSTEDQDGPINGSPSWAVEPPKAWPFGHEDFCDELETQQLMSLEIASGTCTTQKAEMKQRGNVQILLPGSLRTRGEFSIVDLAVQPSRVERKRKTKFVWQVTNVDFHNMYHLP